MFWTDEFNNNVNDFGRIFAKGEKEGQPERRSA
jgi:hypothetical protein